MDRRFCRYHCRGKKQREIRILSEKLRNSYLQSSKSRPQRAPENARKTVPVVLHSVVPFDRPFVFSYFETRIVLPARGEFISLAHTSRIYLSRRFAKIDMPLVRIFFGFFPTGRLDIDHRYPRREYRSLASRFSALPTSGGRTLILLAGEPR